MGPFCQLTVNANRVIFKNSITYTEGVIDDLSKYKNDMMRTKDHVGKLAIAQTVSERFANFDESKIQSQDLRQFLADCRNLDVDKYSINY